MASRRPLTSNVPYVVMIGDVGIGKSTLVEKLTGFTRLSSSSSKSFTKHALVFTSWTRKMQICDTPGSNPMGQRYEHNFWIAQAMSYKPVSSLLIVVQARARMSNVLDEIIKYAEAFEPKEFTNIVAACVTHMDTITDWDEREFREALFSQTGIEKVVFSDPKKPFMQLESDILGVCHPCPVNISVNSENFLRFFKINDRNYKILRSVRREVARFEAIKNKFYAGNEILRSTEKIELEEINSDRIDMIFEFQAWMTGSIVEAQKRVSDDNDFTFHGPLMANEAGHIANLTNQLKTVLLELRTRCLHFTSSHGINELRKCPHCGLVWAKVVGCEGTTTCGKMVDSIDVRNKRTGVMATYAFNWDERAEVLAITRVGERHVRKQDSTTGQLGCGNNINWSTMALVDVPEEFCATHEVHVNDISSLPEDAMEQWDTSFEREKDKFKIKEEVQGQEELPFPRQESLEWDEFATDPAFETF